jgi:hypothetical protein
MPNYICQALIFEVMFIFGDHTHYCKIDLKFKILDIIIIYYQNLIFSH